MMSDKVKERLRRLGQTDKELLRQKLRRVGLTPAEFFIMEKRYAENLPFKQIYPALFMEERSMYRHHKTAIEKTVDTAIAEFLSPFQIS
mgnify:CR=1 FL=1